MSYEFDLIHYLPELWVYLAFKINSLQVGSLRLKIKITDAQQLYNLSNQNQRIRLTDWTGYFRLLLPIEKCLYNGRSRSVANNVAQISAVKSVFMQFNTTVSAISRCSKKTV